LARQIRHFARGFNLKTLHKYLTGQVLATLLLTVGGLRVCRAAAQRAEGCFAAALRWPCPAVAGVEGDRTAAAFACVYALPMGFITATLLVFGRFSADQELTLRAPVESAYCP